MRRAAPTHPIWLLVGAALLAPTPALAQRSGGPIDLQLFRPSIDSKGLITLNASQVLGHLDLSFGLLLNWSHAPLSISGNPASGRSWCNDASATCAPGSDAFVLSRYNVNNMVTGNLQAAVGLFKHFEVGLGLPLTFWAGDTSPNPTEKDQGKIDAQGAGDLGLHLKGRILNTSKHPVGLSVVGSVSLPTGDSDGFLGSGRVGFAPTVVLDRDMWRGRLLLAFNLGAVFRFGSTEGWTDSRGCAPPDNPRAAPADYIACGTQNPGDDPVLQTSHHLRYGLGASVSIVKQRLDLVAEIIGQTGFDGLFDPDRLNSAHEVLAGFRLYLARNSYFTFGAGRGLRGSAGNHQYGSPDFRAFLGFIFEPSIGDRDGDGIKDDVDKCPDEPEDFDDFEDEDGCPDPDNDRDGIPDFLDKCPNEPEDFDGFEDEDGCPEPDVLDRDGDGIPDHLDKCPDDPEDFDGFEDEDGCPDPDNDRDGILDVDDLCPNDPEDFDGFEDEDGCPDPDNDKDRIADALDKCPNEPETYNGFEDEDGCPDKGRVVVHKGRIEILDKIYFETDKAVIKPVSFPILDAIAATLKGNPQILLVEIQGHADERGTYDHNMRLTDDRANSVLRYLVNKGVESSRLKAKGYGATRPVDRRSNEAAWSKNRRVEFVIEQRAQ